MDNKGQLSLEYVLIAMIGILLLTIVSFPLINFSIDSSNDVIDSIMVKNELNKISDGINYCYYSGKGSKRTVLLDFKNEISVSFLSSSENKSIIKSKINLNNGNKEMIIDSNAPLQTKTISFNKGFNKVLIQWSQSSNKIIINKI